MLARRREHCANWTGAHAISNGCILYGQLTAEMAVHIPDDNPALFDWGTFVNGGTPDPTWNEIDQIFRIGPNGSEYHTTYFTPGEHKTVFNPYSVPSYNGYIAEAFHNYTIDWTPEYLAWSIDRQTYRNITVRSSTNRRAEQPLRGCKRCGLEQSPGPGSAAARARQAAVATDELSHHLPNGELVLSWSQPGKLQTHPRPRGWVVWTGIAHGERGKGPSGRGRRRRMHTSTSGAYSTTQCLRPSRPTSSPKCLSSSTVRLRAQPRALPRCRPPPCQQPAGPAPQPSRCDPG